jgi:uncharacterized protein YehS (DUF1456 family)
VEEQPVNKEVELSQEEVINFLRKYKEAGCKSVLHSILEPFISEAKRNMFTELILKEVCRISSEKPAKSLIKKICNPQQVYSKEMIYGLKHESDALSAYLDAHKQRHTGVKLKKVCCIINCEYPQLNATPDSLV